MSKTVAWCTGSIGLGVSRVSGVILDEVFFIALAMEEHAIEVHLIVLVVDDGVAVCTL
jgi:hypothetical protein